MKILLNAQCNAAMPMMVVTSGSRCDRLLRSCGRAQPYSLLSNYDSLKESQRRSKGWCLSKESLSLGISSFAGVRISSHRNLLKFKFHGSAAYSKVTGSELCTPFRKVSVIGNPRGEFGKRTQERIVRSSSRVYAKGESEESLEQNRGSVVKQTTNPIERDLEDNLSLDSEVVSESSVSKQRYGGVLGDGISNSEYQKIQDLKFSGDMWENDSGPQVLDLQRMLYWFGYLPRRTELTAYFGLETKRALQQFQIAHGVPGTGAWGSSSRQALWKLLSEDNSSFSKGGSSACSDPQQPVSSLVDSVTAGGTDIGIRVSELLSNMGGQSQEFMSTMSTAPYWRHLPTNVPRNAAIFGLLVGTVVALFSLGYSIVGFFHEHQQGQPVRRRVLRAHWRDDLSGTISTKSKRHLDMFPGLDLPVVGEGDFEYRLRSKSRPSAGRTDRLILYEGQVLVGDESPTSALPFMNGPASRRGSRKFVSQSPPRMKASLISGLAPSDQISEKSASNGSIPGQFDSKLSRTERNSKLGGKGWQDKDEESFKDRVEELRKAVHATEKNRQAAMRALADERQRSLELQVKISRQKETAAALEEEVRVLKESHDALLTSLRKKYSSSVAARAAAALLYQNWDASYEEGNPQTLSF